ncbi:uncharacterized protein C2845_PM17G11720 [Panicum miliaceum]|uniref:DUF4220 domain-containing protein n=1 Tax=Panicum miliaceum TaxID=4540 RepID=A0A3L6Q6X1_PANMI|nr:uncharacterized protein C2845_PM17G11720 [Panicum miliaceum]
MATLLGCKDLLDQLWSMETSKSSPDITKLIHGYITRGWTEHHITDTPTYRAFNDNRGQWTLSREGCGSLEWSLRRPFDESIVLWHLTTDLCFHRTVTPSSHETARRCREMSNYMAYLLFVKPDMLMTGARRSLFRAACKDIQRLLNEDPQQDGPENTLLDDERGLTVNIAQRAMITNDAPYIIHEARWLSTCLMALRSDDDEDKMWRVIQGVWVEMLCFSAGRCRGYLHAKSLGSGGEYLSYIWLLLLYMGMETLMEKMQRTELHEDRMAAGLSSAAPMAATGNDNV